MWGMVSFFAASLPPFPPPCCTAEYQGKGATAPKPQQEKEEEGQHPFSYFPPQQLLCVSCGYFPFGVLSAGCHDRQEGASSLLLYSFFYSLAQQRTAVQS